MLGVCLTTIRRRDKNKLIRCIRTPWGHRWIHKKKIEIIISGKKRMCSKKNRGVVTYARVSSHDQKKKGGLDRQLKKLREYCLNNNLTIVS